MNMVLFEKRLQIRQKNENQRQLKISTAPIDFASNDYLGLARSRVLFEATLKEWQQCPLSPNYVGSTGSRLLTGHSSYAQELEETIANFHGFPTSILFNCGYMANLGLLSCVADSQDKILFDAHIHASTKNGMQLSPAQTFSFRHNDVEHLEKRLKNIKGQGKIFICIESIYSTDGSKAPLKQICKLSQKYEAFLIVDEAHAIGVYGTQGQGLVFESQLQQYVFALVVTFGKALGTHGAAVLGHPILKDILINFASSFIYTTALPTPVLTSIKCSYNLLPKLHSERKQLLDSIRYMKESLPYASQTPIQSIQIKGNSNLKKIAYSLSQEGFDVRPLMSPTIQRGQERLRLCLHAFNSQTEIQTLLERVKHYQEKLHA